MIALECFFLREVRHCANNTCKMQYWSMCYFVKYVINSENGKECVGSKIYL